jgi:hypothetical protein
MPKDLDSGALQSSFVFRGLNRQHAAPILNLSGDLNTNGVKSEANVCIYRPRRKMQLEIPNVQYEESFVFSAAWSGPCT